MILTTLFAISIVAVSVLFWLFRRRFTKYLPTKEAMGIFCLVGPVVLLLGVAVLPDVLLLVSALAFMPHYLKTIVGLSAAACIIYAGCSKKADTPQPHAIHWRTAETGYTAETVPAAPPDIKEGP